MIVLAEALANVLGEPYIVPVGVRDRDDDVDEMHGDVDIRYNIYWCCIISDRKNERNDDTFC